MFTPLNMQVRESESVKRLTGAYAIHEEILNNLSDEEFLEFRKNNYLPAIYSHLTSLAQINRLAELRTKRNK